MKRLTALFVFCFLIKSGYSQGTYIVALTDVYKEFQAAISKENPDVKEAGNKAIKQINKANKPYKKYGWCNASYYSALIYNEMEEFDKALAEIDDCTPGDFHQDEIEERMVLKGSILDRLNQYQGALDAYLKAQAAYDRQTHRFMSLYHYAGPLKRMYASLGDYENALKYNYLSDSSLGIKYALADFYHAKLAEKNIRVKWEDLFTEARENDKAGNQTAAYQKYTEAINLNSLYADAYYYRGILGLKMRKYTEAEKDLNECYSHLNYQFPKLNFLAYISSEAVGKFTDDYYSFYDRYPASERTKLLSEYGISGSSRFVSLESRNAEAARQNKLRYEQEQRNSPPVITQPKVETVCTCEKCGGSGKISFKAFKTWEISNGTDKYGNAKTIKQSGYVDEEQTCTRCLGSGKCK
ncbi:MAG: hypothetical protein IPP31_11345 [Chitinophagaceae bacterium]|nr:hypothetical protein [Chitinophagaceae bacterium]